MRISIREVKDYQKCPLYYKLKHVDEIAIDKTVDDYFKECFKTALYAYYFSILDKKKKSFDSLLKRWEDLWFSSDMMEIIPEESLKEKSNQAVSMFNSFFKRMGTEVATPIAVNFSYEAIFPGKENLHVTGEIDLIKVVNDRTIKSETVIAFFNQSNKVADSFMVKGDIGISVASHAFRSNFKSREDKIIVNNVLLAEDTPTLRTGADFERAEKAIRNIYRAIKGGVFYPSPNPINCHSCPYKMFCLSEKSISTGGEINGS